MDTVIITGANRGIGLAAAKQLAGTGHPIVMLCRDADRGRGALAELPLLPPPHSHRLVVCDLASFASVRDAARQITGLAPRIAALVNNAAVLVPERTLSRDGFEIQLAVTHLGHFLLTNLLLPLLHRPAGPCRVVTVSSAAHAGPAFDFEDPNFVRRPYKRSQAYQQSKLANILFTFALARRTAGTGIEPVCTSPGRVRHGPVAELFGQGPGRGFGGNRLRGKAGPCRADPGRSGGRTK